MTRSLFRFAVTRSHVVVLLVLIVLVTSLGGIVLANSVEFAPVGALLGALVGVLIDVLVLVLTFEKTRRRVDVIAPANGDYGIGLGDTAMRIEVPVASSDVAYRAFQSVERRDGFVFLRHRSSRLYTVLPAELFADGAIEGLRQRIVSS